MIRHSAIHGSLRHKAHMDVGSAENTWSNFQPTAMDVGSADIVRSRYLSAFPWAQKKEHHDGALLRVYKFQESIKIYYAKYDYVPPVKFKIILIFFQSNESTVIFIFFVGLMDHTIYFSPLTYIIIREPRIPLEFCVDIGNIHTIYLR